MPGDSGGKAIGKLWTFAIGGIALIILFIFAFFGMEDKGLVSAFSFTVIAVVMRVRWDLRNEWSFRIYIGACIALHLYLIASFGWRIDVKPTILLAPIVVVDFIAVLAGVFLVERLFN
jgi:hypothetical protein